MKKKKMMGIMALSLYMMIFSTTLPVFAMESQDIQGGENGSTAECQVTYTQPYDFSETIPKYPKLEVSALGFSGIYDGKYHGISVNCKEEGIKISYSKDGTNYSEKRPEYKEPGTYTVYYKVEKEDYETATGSCKVIITPKNNGNSQNNGGNGNGNNNNNNNNGGNNNSNNSGSNNNSNNSVTNNSTNTNLNNNLNNLNTGNNASNNTSNNASNNTSSVRTGDESNILLYGILMIASIFGFIKCKKRKEK